MSREQHLEALDQAVKAGDYQAANEIAAFIDTNFPEQQDMTAGEIAKGIGGTALQMATGAIAEPFAGIAGIAGSVLPGEVGQGAQWVENVREALTPTPGEETQRVMGAIGEYIPDVAGYIGGQVLEATGSPSLATIAHTAPEAIMMRLGMKAPDIASKLSKRGQNLTDQEIEVVRKEIEDLQTGRPTEAGITETAQALTEKQPDLSGIAQVDPKVMQAADELGLGDVPAQVATSNAQFRDIAQGLASVSGSQAKAQYGAFLERMADKADEIIIQGGGDLDKPAVSQRFRDEVDTVTSELAKSEKDIYDQIRDKITVSARVEPENIRSFVDSQVAKFGGVEELPKLYRDMFNMLYKPGGGGVVRPDTVNIGGRSYILKTPTYGAFDQKRKDIGQALRKKSGPYADSESGTLKAMYSNLKRDQDKITTNFGANKLQEGADALTIKRKALEDTAVDLLGNKLDKDLMPQVAARIGALPKGNVKKFTETIEAIPENLRQEVVVSSLNDILRGTGADQKGFGAARFVGLMEDLNRSPTARAALNKYLPKETQRSLDNFYKLARGVYRANKENITTGKISQFFPDTRNFLSKMISGVVRGAVASKTGGLGVEAVDSIGDMLRNTTPNAQRANELIASKQFQDMMKEAVRDGVHEGGLVSDKTKRLERLVQKSNTYKKWADNLEGSAKADLAALGLTQFLLQADEEQ